eukprot:TRINITY_DN20450_c0_g2_i2.p1 TRINITY_DN20450_c0_g2~~TRINITY_DN20450_c0_g2_i2.p1  ORF type:complete len:915 (+),score=157.51 TRINITY_DN20450_c0_g2_i2:111-2855(+)
MALSQNDNVLHASSLSSPVDAPPRPRWGSASPPLGPQPLELRISNMAPPLEGLQAKCAGSGGQPLEASTSSVSDELRSSHVCGVKELLLAQMVIHEFDLLRASISAMQQRILNHSDFSQTGHEPQDGKNGVEPTQVDTPPTELVAVRTTIEDPTSPKTDITEETYAPGDRVSYWSSTAGKYIPATVMRFNSKGCYDLNVKKRANIVHISKLPEVLPSSTDAVVNVGAIPSKRLQVDAPGTIQEEDDGRLICRVVEELALPTPQLKENAMPIQQRVKHSEEKVAMPTQQLKTDLLDLPHTPVSVEQEEDDVKSHDTSAPATEPLKQSWKPALRNDIAAGVAGVTRRSAKVDHEAALRLHQARVQKSPTTALRAANPNPADIVSYMSRFDRSNVSDEGQGFVSSLLGSPRWDMFVCVMILLYTIFVGIQIDYTTKHVESDIPIAFYVVGYGFTLFFLVELLLRVYSEGVKFFTKCDGSNKYWNYLDFILVTSACLEVIVDIQTMAGLMEEGNNGSTAQIRIIRILRITRLMKVFRVARIIRFIRALRTLINSIVCTLRSVSCALILMLMIIYVFGMIMVQSVRDHITDHGDTIADLNALEMYWGTLVVCMFTLLKTIIGGISWHDCVVPLEDVPQFLLFVFLIYVLFMYFAVLNVITAVFCESAIQSTRNDQELVIQEQLLNKQNYVHKLQLLFADIDADGSGSVSREELEKFLDGELSGAFFEYLELDVTCANDIMKLIDLDGSGELDVEEFIEGIYRLRGQARALHLAELGQDLRSFQEVVLDALKTLQDIASQKSSCGGTPAVQDSPISSSKSKKSSGTKTFSYRPSAHLGRTSVSSVNFGSVSGDATARRSERLKRGLPRGSVLSSLVGGADFREEASAIDGPRFLKGRNPAGLSSSRGSWMQWFTPCAEEV